MCMLDSAEYTLNILKNDTLTARKEHKCCECYRVIGVGEKYNYQAGTGDAGFEVFKTCSHCLAPRNLIQDKCRGFVYEAIQEDLGEHIHVKEWGFKAARFYISMKRKLKKFFSDELMPIPQY